MYLSSLAMSPIRFVVIVYHLMYWLSKRISIEVHIKFLTQLVVYLPLYKHLDMLNYITAIIDMSLIKVDQLKTGK